MTPRRIPAGRLVREVVPILVVGGLVFHLLRTHVAERYLVPSPSMEPALHGDERDGDVVLVDKTAAWLEGRDWLQPFALVVVQDREADGEHHIVKRLIAIGPTVVELRDGDVFVRDPETGAMHRLVKDPTAHPDLRQTAFVVDPVRGNGLDWLAADDRVWSRVPGALEVRARPDVALTTACTEAAQAARRAAGDLALPGFLSTTRQINTSFLTCAGDRLGGTAWPRDIGVAVDFELPAHGPTAIHVVVEYPRAGTTRSATGSTAV